MKRHFVAFGILGRYLARQNIFFMLICLGVGTGVYLLSDIFDRLDDFVKAGLSGQLIIYYFFVKIPVIFSQIMPAVFLLSLVIQMGVLSRSRELVALRAGGISFGWFVAYFFIYALIWSCAQLVFSQYVGVFGEHEANRIWKQEVRKYQLDEMRIDNIWFREGPFIVHASQAIPNQNRADDVTVYEFELDSRQLVRVLNAKRALVDENGWGLLDVTELDVRSFSSTQRVSQFLSVRQNLKAFSAVQGPEDKTQLPLWDLSRVIQGLEASGANVERLRTAWHSKISYAFTIVVMALMAMVLVSVSENLYMNVGVSLLLAFLLYGMHVVGVSAGQKGVMPPVVAAWMGNIVLGGLSSLWLFIKTQPRLEHNIRKHLNALKKR